MFLKKTAISSSSGVTPARESTTQMIASAAEMANEACLKIFAGMIASSSGTMPPVSTSSVSNDPLPVERPVPEAIAESVGTPSALTLDGDLVVFTTRATYLNGELSKSGALFVADKRAPDALMIGLDREGATYEALATDGTNAYVAVNDGRIVSTPLRGGESKKLATLDAGALQIAVGNGRFYGGGTVVAEDAAIDDGHLDLYSLEIRTVFKLALMLQSFRSGAHGAWSEVRTLRGTEFEIRTRRPRPVNADGELIAETPAVFRVHPGAITVFAPPGAAAPAAPG